jgi:hypothetical protein
LSVMRANACENRTHCASMPFIRMMRAVSKLRRLTC